MKLQNKIGLVAMVPSAVFATMTLLQVGSHRAIRAYMSNTSAPAGSAALAIAGATGWDETVVFRALVAPSLLAIGIVGWWCCGARRRPDRRHTPLVLAGLIAWGLLAHTDILYFIPLLAGYLLGWRRARWFAAAGALAVVAVRLPYALGWAGAWRPRWMPLDLAMTALTQLCLQLLAAGVGHLIAAEQRGRERIALAHAELLATQQLLGEAVRASERRRIAHDLHDSLGHGLTALAVNLQLAALRDPAQDQPLRTAHRLSCEMLEQVRAVVAAERDLELDWRASLRTLCGAIPRPQVALDIAPELSIASPAVAHSLFFAIREAVTNAVRHAGASRITVAVAAEGAVLRADIHDDGRGAPAGEHTDVRSIRERIEGVGGSVAVHNRADGGFAVAIAIPGVAA